MGKRSSFTRHERDAYDTPAEAVAPLLEHLKPRTKFIDPCAGAGCLANHFERFGHVCVGKFDLPDRDATSARYDDVELAAIFLTNLPWGRTTLHPAIINLSGQRPLWTLLDADWVHTKQAIPFMPRLKKIVSVGRVRWIPNSPYDGKDNSCWCLFAHPQPNERAVTHFHGRIGSNPANSRRAA